MSGMKHLLTPKTYLLFLATLVALAASYYFIVALPAHNREMLQLEGERSAEQAKLERHRAEQAGLERHRIDKHRLRAESERYIDCLVAAEKQYWKYVKLNGGQEEGKGMFAAPRWVWKEARKVRQDALDECERHRRFHDKRDKSTRDRALKGQ